MGPKRLSYFELVSFWTQNEKGGVPSARPLFKLIPTGLLGNLTASNEEKPHRDREGKHVKWLWHRRNGRSDPSGGALRVANRGAGNKTNFGYRVALERCWQNDGLHVPAVRSKVGITRVLLVIGVSCIKVAKYSTI